MKRNAFGEMRIQPGDDLAAAWSEEFCLVVDEDFSIYAGNIEHDDVMGWSCSLSDEFGNESECHNFGSRDEIISYLTDQGVGMEDD